jgi:hypothetical protein
MYFMSHQGIASATPANRLQTMSSDLLSTQPTRRSVLLAALSTVASMPACVSAPPAAVNSRLRLIGEARLPYAHPFKGTTVGGISGLDYDPSADLWYALSDDGSSISPARFYTLRLRLTDSSLGTPELLDVVTLLRPDGTAFPGPRQSLDAPDPEAIRFLPRTKTVLWTSEGDINRRQDPFVREATTDGRYLRQFELPSMLRASSDAGSGPRHNLTFEGLAITPDGGGAWVGMEAPLRHDGPVPGVGLPGGPCRFTLYDMPSGRAIRQIAYMPDAIPQAPSQPNGYADNGVSEILLIDEHRLLVLERAYMAGVGNSLRLYQIDTRAGSDTLASGQLLPGQYQPSPKTLLLDFAQAGIARLDNTEAMAWGPRLANGRRTLVFASDDNFNPGQITQFLAFEFQEKTR